MTATSPNYQRALTESMIGHVAVLLLACVTLAISSWVRPAEPVEEVIEIALFSGPVKAGGLGAPPPDAVPEQPPAPPAPAPPRIEEPEIKEPPPVRIEEPKPPDPAPVKETVPDNPVVEKKPEPPPKPPKHEVQVSTKVVKVDAPKNASPPEKKKVIGTLLTAAEVAKLLNKGLPESRNGGVGLRGDPRSTGIETGREGTEMEIYKAALKARLYNAWQRPAGVEGLRTDIQLSIARNGSFISAVIVRRSGNEAMDSSALQAVRTVAPTPLPASTAAPYTIKVEFDASGVSV